MSDLKPSQNSNQISISQSARNAKNWAKLWKAIETNKGKELLSNFHSFRDICVKGERWKAAKAWYSHVPNRRTGANKRPWGPFSEIK